MPLSRKRAKVGTLLSTAFSKPISVRGLLLVADDDGGFGDILEAAILDPQLVGVLRIDVDGDRHIAKRVADQGEADLMLADRRFALAFEDRIDQRELPGRRSLLGEDAVAAAVEMQVLGLVADLVSAARPEPIWKSMWLR